jgi:protein-disulfide isomerase
MAVLAVGAVLWNMDFGSTTIEPSGSCDGKWCRGAIDATVIIDVYPDFDCHVCVEKERMVSETLDMYPGLVRMVYHPYPSSALGQMLAEALEAAGEQGKFWELHDKFLQQVPGDMSELRPYAAEIGLDIQKFDEALNSGKFEGKVELAKQEAISQGVKQVAVFINGNEYQEYPGTLSDLSAAIDEELKKTEAQ